MAGVVVLTGRAKDTIVLSSGENIEPSSIEDAAVCSPLIKFCVLLGQDRRSLGALVVPDPEAWEELEKEKGEFDGLSITAGSECSSHSFLSRTVESVIDRRYRQDKAFAPWFMLCAT